MSYFGGVQLPNSLEGVAESNAVVTLAMLDVLRKQLEGQFKWQWEEVQKVRMELEQEKKARRETEEMVNKCIDKLKEGLAYVTIEIAKLDMQLEKLEEEGDPTQPVPIPATFSNSKPSGCPSSEVIVAEAEIIEKVSTNASAGCRGDEARRSPGKQGAAGVEQVDESKAPESEAPLPLETCQSSSHPDKPDSIGNGEGHEGESESDTSSSLDTSGDYSDSDSSSTTDFPPPSRTKTSNSSNSKKENEAPTQASTTSALLAPNGVIAMALNRLPGRVTRNKPGRTPTNTVPPRSTRYQCKPCKKGFSTQSDYQNHWARTHKKKLPHPCPQCGKTFPQKQGLDRHLRSRHPENKQRLFYCLSVNCLKAYTNEMNLQAHIKSKHSDEDLFK